MTNGSSLGRSPVQIYVYLDIGAERPCTLLETRGAEALHLAGDARRLSSSGRFGRRHVVCFRGRKGHAQGRCAADASYKTHKTR